jgi:hypothetical protein
VFVVKQYRGPSSLLGRSGGGGGYTNSGFA